MRYKFFITLLFVFFVLFNVTSVHANSAAPIYAIIVNIEGCMSENYENYENIDVLINQSSYSSSNISSAINLDYIIEHENYLDYDYMNDSSTDWISYTAYYKDADVIYDHCSLYLMDTLSFEIPVLEVKIVYFSDLGETLFLSEIVNIDPELTHTRIEGSIIFNTNTFEITNTMSEYEPSSFFDNLRYLPMLIFASLFFTPVLIFVSSIIEAIISGFFKFKQLNRTSVFWLNVLTQIVMYLTFSKINLNYYVTLIIVEILIYATEYFVLIKVFKEEDKRKVLYFVLIANTVTLLMGHLLGFY